MKKLGLAILFTAGVILTATVSFQLTLGAILIAVSYAEFRKEGIDLNQVDDILIEKLRNVLNKGTNNEQK